MQLFKWVGNEIKYKDITKEVSYSNYSESVVALGDYEALQTDGRLFVYLYHVITKTLKI